MSRGEPQADLFADALPVEALRTQKTSRRRPSRVAPMVPPDEMRALAARLPRGLYLGTSTWSFPGWAGLVYAESHAEAALARDRAYDEARSTFAPFDRLVAPDPDSRARIATLVRSALARGREVFVIVNNKAEGSAPLGVHALAQEILR